MGFSGWLYCRHRRRKQLGHYTTSFAYTPAGGVHSFPSGQSEKYSSKSSDSPIYSTINRAAVEEDLLTYYDAYSSVPYPLGLEPYASTPALTTTDAAGSSSLAGGLERGLDLHWTIQSSQAESEYAKLQYSRTTSAKKSKQQHSGRPSNLATLNWVDVLSQPLPSDRDHHRPAEDNDHHHHRHNHHHPRQRHLDLLAPASASTAAATVTRSSPHLLFSPRGGEVEEEEEEARGDRVADHELYHTLHWPEDPRRGEEVEEDAAAGKDLPPPPAPPTEQSVRLLSDPPGCVRASAGDRTPGSPGLQKRRGYVSPQKRERGPSRWLAQDENVILYGQSGVLPKVQLSDYGSQGGVSLGPSTGPRAPGSSKSRDENLT
ncbi:hypothetical protein CRUP_031679 [Coryphaenoides rupestris]|nr:hypothetical protein CRUP_031679 [Coryphaenoides rupestris]